MATMCGNLSRKQTARCITFSDNASFPSGSLFSQLGMDPHISNIPPNFNILQGVAITILTPFNFYRIESDQEILPKISLHFASTTTNSVFKVQRKTFLVRNT